MSLASAPQRCRRFAVSAQRLAFIAGSLAQLIADCRGAASSQRFLAEVAADVVGRKEAALRGTAVATIISGSWGCSVAVQRLASQGRFRGPPSDPRHPPFSTDHIHKEGQG